MFVDSQVKSFFLDINFAQLCNDGCSENDFFWLFFFDENNSSGIENIVFGLRIAGENKEGRSLKIYLFNEKSQVPDLEEILPAGKFDESYFIYPKNSIGNGYILNIETRSFGRLPSENLLSRVEFYAVDFNYLQNLQGDTLSNNDLKITNVKKYGTWMYIVDVQYRGLIQLGQGYDEGWKAFEISNIKFQISNF